MSTTQLDSDKIVLPETPAQVAPVIDQWAAMHARLATAKIQTWLDRAAHELARLGEDETLDPFAEEVLELLQRSLKSGQMATTLLLASLSPA